MSKATAMRKTTNKGICVVLVSLLFLNGICFNAYADQSPPTNIYTNPFYDLATQNQVPMFDFSWSKDLGLNNTDVQQIYKSLGDIYGLDQLYAGDIDVWLSAAIGIFNKSAGQELLVNKFTNNAMNELLSPDPNELSKISETNDKLYAETIKELADMGTMADAGEISSGVLFTSLVPYVDELRMRGKAEAAIRLENFLHAPVAVYIFSKGISLVSAGSSVYDLGTKINDFTKYGSYLQSQDTRVMGLRLFLNNRFAANNSPKDIWDEAIMDKGYQALSYYNEHDGANKFMKAAQELSHETSETITSIFITPKVWSAVGWELYKMFSDAGMATSAAEKMMTVLALTRIENAVSEEYNEVLKQVIAQNGTDPLKLDELRNLGLLDLRCSIKIRSLLIESYKELKLPDSEIIVGKLQTENNEAYDYLMKWQYAPTKAISMPTKQGNTSGNVVNSAYAAQQGDWIYYTNFNYVDLNDLHALYKMRSDGSGKTKLSSDMAHGINCLDNWVYYLDGKCNIYKVTTDGQQKTKVTANWCQRPIVVGDWIYYLGDLGAYGVNRIMKVRLDGSQRFVINNENSGSPNIVGDWIYYSSWDNGSKLFKIRTDGSGRTQLNNEYTGNLVADNNWIYYAGEDQKLYKIRTDGTGRVKLNDLKVRRLNLSNGWIFFSTEQGIYKLATDGTGLAKISSDTPYDLCILGDWIFYEYHDAMGDFYKIRTDGSQRQAVK